MRPVTNSGTSKPQILFLSQALPYPPTSGVSNRTFNVLKQLQTDFDITLVAFSRVNHQLDTDARESSRRSLEDLLTSVYPPIPIPSEHSRVRRLWDHTRSIWRGCPYTFYEYWDGDFEASIENALVLKRIDLVHIDSLDLYRWLAKLPSVPKVCTHHSIESELLRLRAHRVKSRIVRRYILHQADLVEQIERNECPRFRLNVMMSELDATKLRTIAPGSQTSVVPNGVDTKYFTVGKGLPPVAGRVVFLGPLYMFPNRDAVEFLLKDIWPDIHAVNGSTSLHVIGSCSQRDRQRYNRHRGVTCLGFVPDVRPYLNEASVSVVPIRVGGGTRLKILDAWAMGKAVVSTSIGCEGLKAINGENILICDTPEAFSDGVLQVLSNSVLRSRLEVNGRKTAEEIYSWDIVGRDMRASYWQLLRGS